MWEKSECYTTNKKQETHVWWHTVHIQFPFQWEKSHKEPTKYLQGWKKYSSYTTWHSTLYCNFSFTAESLLWDITDQYCCISKLGRYVVLKYEEPYGKQTFVKTCSVDYYAHSRIEGSYIRRLTLDVEGGVGWMELLSSGRIEGHTLKVPCVQSAVHCCEFEITALTEAPLCIIQGLAVM